MTSQGRFHYVDSMRSILMLLGVVLHAASIYTLASTWYVRDPQKSFAFDLIVNTIHTFRMPAFFIIAGFFAAMALSRGRGTEFLKLRLVRIGIPLVATAVCFNTFEPYARDVFIARSPLPLWPYLQKDVPARLANGDWMSHLWFLVNLLPYSLAAVAAYGVVRRWRGPVFWPLARMLRERSLYLWVLPLFSLLLAGAGHLSPRIFHGDHVFGLIQPIDFLDYLVFFLFGMWLFADAELQANFLAVRPWHVLLFAVAAADWGAFARTAGVSWEHLVEIYSEGVLAWMGCKFCFAFFRTYLDRPSRLFAYLADASYSVYLFHHLVVIALGSLLIGVAWPIALKFLVVAAGGFAITLALHHFLVLRFAVLRLLFNGKPLRRVRIAEIVPRPPVGGAAAPANDLALAGAGGAQTTA